MVAIRVAAAVAALTVQMVAVTAAAAAEAAKQCNVESGKNGVALWLYRFFVSVLIFIDTIYPYRGIEGGGSWKN